MRNKRFLTGRALMLGLFVLALIGTGRAQDKPAIERMNDRVAEWQKAPADRFMGFEVAFPATPEEAALVGNNAFLLITTASVVREEAFSSSVFVLVDGKQFTLAAFGNTLITAHPEGYYRSDKVMALPLKWANAAAQLKVTAGSKFEEVSLGNLPESKLPISADAEFKTPAMNGPSTKDILQRDFKGLELAAQKVRISSGVAAGLLVKMVRPVYPPEAREGRISGAVTLGVTIGKDGKLQNIHVFTGHPMLVDAAINAVRQWEYKPYLLNGNPVEVETQITVNFNLGGF